MGVGVGSLIVVAVGDSVAAGGFVDSAVGKLVAVGSEAVSYTHLTLPTILLV